MGYTRIQDSATKATPNSETGRNNKREKIPAGDTLDKGQVREFIRNVGSSTDTQKKTLDFKMYKRPD